MGYKPVDLTSGQGGQDWLNLGISWMSSQRNAKAREKSAQIQAQALNNTVNAQVIGDIITSMRIPGITDKQLMETYPVLATQMEDRFGIKLDVGGTVEQISARVEAADRVRANYVKLFDNSPGGELDARGTEVTIRELDTLLTQLGAQKQPGGELKFPTMHADVQARLDARGGSLMSIEDARTARETTYSDVRDYVQAKVGGGEGGLNLQTGTTTTDRDPLADVGGAREMNNLIEALTNDEMRRRFGDDERGNRVLKMLGISRRPSQREWDIMGGKQYSPERGVSQVKEERQTQVREQTRELVTSEGFEFPRPSGAKTHLKGVKLALTEDELNAFVVLRFMEGWDAERITADLKKGGYWVYDPETEPEIAEEVAGTATDAKKKARAAAVAKTDRPGDLTDSMGHRLAEGSTRLDSFLGGQRPSHFAPPLPKAYDPRSAGPMGTEGPYADKRTSGTSDLATGHPGEFPEHDYIDPIWVREEREPTEKELRAELNVGLQWEYGVEHRHEQHSVYEHGVQSAARHGPHGHTEEMPEEGKRTPADMRLSREQWVNLHNRRKRAKKALSRLKGKQRSPSELR